MRAIKPKGLNYNVVYITLLCMGIFLFVFFGIYGIFFLFNYQNNITNHTMDQLKMYTIPTRQTIHESICDYNNMDVCLLSIYVFFGGVIGSGVILYIIYDRIRLACCERYSNGEYDLV